MQAAFFFDPHDADQCFVYIMDALKEPNYRWLSSFRKVVLSSPYYASKDLFGPKEKLKIRIQDGTDHLEVIRE